MAKTFMGVRLIRLREEQRPQPDHAREDARHLTELPQPARTQPAAAHGVSILLRINEQFGVDVQMFSRMTRRASLPMSARGAR